MKSSGLAAPFKQWYLAVFILLGTAAISQAKWLTIHNDFYQYDKDGNKIQTRSGCLNKFNDTYYWYGSNNANGWRDQTCYTSTDLLHWTYKGVALAAPGTNRMDVVYNSSTKQYIMYLKTQVGSNCDLGIATSASPEGPFTLKGNYKVFGYQIGDPSAYVDDDGKAYYLFVWDSVPGANSGDKSEHVIASFSQDYLSLSQKLQVWHRGSREAPMLMKRRGIYYYLTSLTLWTQSTATQYYTAPSPSGPWKTTLVPMITPGNTANNSWDTQCDYVFTFKGPRDTVYMYCGDRWERPDPARLGDYVWLPITFSPKDSVVVNYYQDWEVDPDAGIWRPFDIKRNLALRKTATASSTSAANVASNVTDSTTWRNYTSTRWTSATSDPQWIQVDLGSAMNINRVILKWDSAYAKAFKIQVSTDGSAWTDVYSTAASGMRCVTDETFATTAARYVRMYGTERGNTAKGYSLFEFMVLSDSLTTGSGYKPEKPAIPYKSSLTCTHSMVRYTVPSNGPVRIEIVDCRGKLVSVVADGFKYAGDYKAVLPASLGRGMYIIRFTAGAEKLAAVQVWL